MGTYNGEKYLRQQLDSILLQEGIKVCVAVADDCSSDQTVSILDEYVKNNAGVISYYVNERNKNFTYNFLDLMFSVKEREFDYYAFSDQDDVWLPEKLLRAIEKIETLEEDPKGRFYCSNLILTDAALQRIGLMEGKKIRKAGIKTFPYENIATGCTVVFDRAFLRQATAYYPKGIRLHDNWLFLIAAYTASYVYDENAYIFYRQHGDNLIGSNRSLLKKAKKFFSYRGPQSALCRELLLGYGEEIEEKNKRRLIVVRDGKKIGNRIKILLFGRCHTFKKTLALKVKALFGKL